MSTSLFPRGNKDNLSIIKVLLFLHNTIIIASEEEEEVEKGGGVVLRGNGANGRRWKENGGIYHPLIDFSREEKMQ